MMREAVDTLLKLLPREVRGFPGTEYPLPVKTTFLGERDVDIETLRRELTEKREGDVKDLIEPVLLAAELVEASQPDREQFFLTDRQVRGYVFTGSKWRAGWVLVLEAAGRPELFDRVKELGFMVFTDTPGVADTVYIGPRDTSPVYFLQMMVRYGLVWGRIRPGDDHEMGHFLEKDMPGFLIIAKDMSPLKYLVTLGLMKLGAPAVVPSTFPFPYGYRVVADDTDEMLRKGTQFPNLRQRYYKDEIISPPEACNPAYAREEFEPARDLGGSPDSFFCLRPAERPGAPLTVVGRRGTAGMGILVEVTADRFSEDVAMVVERAALGSLNSLSGVRSREDADDVFHLPLRADADPDDRLLAETIVWGIRSQYVRLEKIAVKIIYDAAELARLAPPMRAYRRERCARVEAMNEENTDEFVACTECRTFSLVHTCILTPGRVPMCASRGYASAKAAAIFGSSSVPWKRRTEENLPLRMVFRKGRVLDSARGEYEGCNRAYRELTGGRLRRVQLHSLRECPHTSCGCFQTLAFWIDSVQGIGIMSRNSAATTPTGQTWDLLANRAGGKQNPGIMGASIACIRSDGFLKGDGGLANVVWVDHELMEKLSDLFEPGKKVATEKDVHTVEELRAFVGR